jgi:hypothetical protein
LIDHEITMGIKAEQATEFMHRAVQSDLEEGGEKAGKS